MFELLKRVANGTTTSSDAGQLLGLFIVLLGVGVIIGIALSGG